MNSAGRQGRTLRLSRAACLVLLAGLSPGAAGCGRSGWPAGAVFPALGSEAEPLRIATTWRAAERRELEREYRAWTAGREAPRLAWVELPAAVKLDRALFRIGPVDVLLGGPTVEYQRLARAGAIARTGGSTAAAPWLITRRLEMAKTPPGAGSGLGPVLDDPRVDPLALAWARGQLGRGGWSNGYASLVQWFGHAQRRAGWQPGWSLATSQRFGGWSPAASARAVTLNEPAPGDGQAVLEEGVAVCLGTPREEAAGLFLQFLVAARGAVPGRPGAAVDPEVNDLIAELLGATLVDAQDELLAVWAALDRPGAAPPSSALAWMTEAPPWPPASIEKILSRSGDRAMAMLQDLAGQVAPDAEVRFWLVQSWLRPRRLIDESVLGELVRAADGRVLREPRVRAWLRAEWTAWARQRYRRVARLAASSVVAGGPVPAP